MHILFLFQNLLLINYQILMRLSYVQFVFVSIEKPENILKGGILKL